MRTNSVYKILFSYFIVIFLLFASILIFNINYPNNKLATVFYLAFFILVFISFLIFNTIVNKLLRPLEKINAAAREYALGNFSVTLDINTNDPIGELATSLNYMADELSKIDSYRRDFVANISHDFRSPLTSIKGYIEAMLDGTIPPELQEKYLKIVLQEANRLTKLTSSLLELNNMDNSGIILQKTKFNIISIIEASTNSFEGTCKKKNISFKLDFKVTSAIVYADQQKIQQVLYNLIDNAIKFSYLNSSITICVLEKNEKIFISVKDTGIGIEQKNQKLIWDRFYKIDSSRGKDKQGTGLGLSIVKEIILAHKENINLISTKDVGSEFIFSLSKMV